MFAYVIDDNKYGCMIVFIYKKTCDAVCS